VSWGLRFKIVVLLCALAALPVFAAATSLGVLEVGRPAILDASFRLATAALPCAQLAFGGVAALRMARAGVDA
jgi:hypothetical protein